MESGHVLYLIQHRDFSGAEISQASLIAADPDALVACPAASPTEGFARELGARTTDLPFRSLRHSAGHLETARSFLRGVRTALDLRRVLRQHPERRLIYAIGIRAGLLASLAAIGMRRRAVWNVPDLLPPRPLRTLVRLAAWLCATRMICLSEFIAADLVGASRRLAKRTSVVNPGVELQRFKPDRAKPGAPIAAIVGHISPVKRTDFAIDVAARILASEPGFRLKVVGSAQFRDEDLALERELRSRVASDPELRGAVELVGRQSDVTKALAGCGFLLHCRADEPFGMVLIEAMALGLPVIAPAAGGALEIVEHGVTGLLFRPGDVAHAADSALRLLANPELVAAMGVAARELVESRFTAGRQLEQTRGLLAAALDSDDR